MTIEDSPYGSRDYVKWNSSHLASRNCPSRASKATNGAHHLARNYLDLAKAAWLVAILAAFAQAGENRILHGSHPQNFPDSESQLCVRSATEVPQFPSVSHRDRSLPSAVDLLKNKETLVGGPSYSLPDAPSETLFKSDKNSPPGSSPPFPESEPPVFQIQAPPMVRSAKTIDRQFFILNAVQLGAVVADVETTVYGLSRGGGEVNPLAGNHPSRLRLYAISLPVDAAVTYWSYYLKKNAPHSKRWRMLPIIGSGIHIGAALHNLAVSH